MRFRQPNIACLPETTPANALLMSALNAGPRRILLGKGRRRLVLARGVQRLILLPRLESHDARLLLRPCTLRPVETRGAIFAGTAGRPRQPILGIGVREPGEALLAHRARHNLLLPVDAKLGFIEPCACPSLPTRVVRHGTNER